MRGSFFFFDVFPLGGPERVHARHASHTFSNDLVPRAANASLLPRDIPALICRIPPGAEVEYTLELVGLPGKEEDMVNTRDDSFTGDAFDSA